MSQKTKTIRRKAKYYWRKNLQRIIDAEVAKRLEKYLVDIESGAMTINEIRTKIGLETIESESVLIEKIWWQKFKQKFKWPN